MMGQISESALEKKMSKSYNNFLVDLLLKFKEKCDESNEEIRNKREVNQDLDKNDMSYISVNPFILDDEDQESSQAYPIPNLLDNQEIKQITHLETQKKQNLNQSQPIVELKSDSEVHYDYDTFSQLLSQKNQKTLTSQKSGQATKVLEEIQPIQRLEMVQQPQNQPQYTMIQQVNLELRLRQIEESKKCVPSIKEIKYLDIEKDLKIRELKFSHYAIEDFVSLRVLYSDYFSHGMWYFTDKKRLEIMYMDREGYFIRSEVFKNYKLKDKFSFGSVQMKTYDPDREKNFELVLFLGQSHPLQKNDVFEYYPVREDKFNKHSFKNVLVFAEINKKDKSLYNEMIKEQKKLQKSQDFEFYIVDEFGFSQLSIPVVFQESRLVILEANQDLENELLGTIYDVVIETDEVQLIMKTFTLSFYNIEEYSPIIWEDYLIILFGQQAKGSYFQAQKLSLKQDFSNVFTLDLWIEDDNNKQFLVDYPKDFVIRSPLIFKDDHSDKWYMVCRVFGAGRNFQDVTVNNRKFENIGNIFEIRIENQPGINTPQRFIMKTIPDMKYFGIKPIENDQRILEQFTFNQRLNQTCYDQDKNIWFLVDMTTTVYILDLQNKVFSQGQTMKDFPI
eukprot:403360300